VRRARGLRVFDRLKTLSRLPGLDSALLIDDSVFRAQQAEAQRSQQEQAGFDSIVGELLAIPGYAVTRYEGAQAEFHATDRRLSLVGAENRRPVVRRDDFELSADTFSGGVTSRSRPASWTSRTTISRRGRSSGCPMTGSWPETSRCDSRMSP
jgi:hypothetical protein